MTKMLSASPGALPPDPRYRLVLCTRHGAPQPLTPSAAYGSPHSVSQVKIILNLFSVDSQNASTVAVVCNILNG